MLLADRRVAVIHLCLAAMEAAWFTPVWLLIYWWNGPRWTAYGVILAVLLAWTVALELLSRTKLVSPGYDAVALGLMIATTLCAVRLIAYAGRPAADLRWLVDIWRDLGDVNARFPPVLALGLANLFLWQRATAATSRDLGFFAVGVSFRLGLLLLIATAGVYLYVRGESLTFLLWVYLAVGLTGSAVARIHEKATAAQTAGSALPMRRMVQLLMAVTATVGGTMLLARVYTPAGVRAFLRWLDPVWRLVAPLFEALLWLAGLLLDPILTFIQAGLSALFRRLAIDIARPAASGAPGMTAQPLRFVIPPQVAALLTHIAAGLAIAALALVVVGVLLLFLERAQRGRALADGEEEGGEHATFGRGLLRRGWRQARDLANLVRRYGLSRHLLEALSVQNIYANVCRIARRRGHGRRPAQPPDIYLPVLRNAFPGHDAALERITVAYMRVHYGDRPVTRAELAQARADYFALQTATRGGAGRDPSG